MNRTCRVFPIAAPLLATLFLLGEFSPAPAPPPGWVPPGGPAANPPAGAKGGAKTGLHLPRANTIGFIQTLTDGAGYNWDIQAPGCVGQGTNYAFAGGLYLQVNGNGYNAGTNQGWTNQARDEVETAPWNLGGLQISRRIKVYKDQGLARWLDIYENNSAQDITAQIQVYTCTNYQMSKVTTNTGGAAFGENDYGLITDLMIGGPNNIPSLMHVLCDARAKVRPAIQTQQNQLYVRYNITVPAGKTAIVCYFEAQNANRDTLTAALKGFKATKLLRDLPPSVRRCIVNFTGVASAADVDLERNENSDAVFLTNGDPIYGTVTNEKFTLQTLFGEFTIPAANLVGMAAPEGEEGTIRALLADGQVVYGKLPADKLQVKVPAGGDLQVPFDRVKQWSFRISKSRPIDDGFSGPFVILRTGDRLAIDGAQLNLTFRTRYGVVPLNPKDLVGIDLDNQGNAVHRAFFANGSNLAGFVEPEKIALPIKIGPKIEVSRDMISQFRFAAEEQRDPRLMHVVLTNGDELFGQITNETLRLATALGTNDIKPANIRVLVFNPNRLGATAMQLWNNTVYRGVLEKPDLSFQVVPGPALTIFANQIVSVECSQAMPPAEDLKKAEELIARLGAQDYGDREAASEALVKLGQGIVPLLQKNLDNKDPEVRNRIEAVLEKLSAGAQAAPDPQKLLQTAD